jgi:hypothetical protein
MGSKKVAGRAFPCARPGPALCVSARAIFPFSLANPSIELAKISKSCFISPAQKAVCKALFWLAVDSRCLEKATSNKRHPAWKRVIVSGRFRQGPLLPRPFNLRLFCFSPDFLRPGEPILRHC